MTASKVDAITERTLAKLSSIQTTMNNYPILNNGQIDIPLGSVDLLLEILSYFGVTEQEVVEWISRMLTIGATSVEGKGEGKSSETVNNVSNGILRAIEESVKLALMANIRGLFNCTIDPILPDYLMYKGSGITINIDSLDVGNFLANDPTDKTGSLFYAQDRIDYPSPKVQWKSKDFNAFLWYLFNPGVGKECIWDNRNNCEFTLPPTADGYILETDKSKLDANGKIKSDELKGAKQILICKGTYGSVYGRTLQVWLNPNLYIRQTNTQDPDMDRLLSVNKTVFEFNHDYIYSLRLFDPKVLVASVINAITSQSINGNIGATLSITLEKQVLRAKIEAIVDKMIKASDMEVEDDFFTFSNDEYNIMLKQAEDAFDGTYDFYEEQKASFSEEDLDKINDILSEISSNATKVEQRQTIEGAIQKLTGIISGPTIVDGKLNPKLTFTYGNNVISRFLKELIVQMVMQILTPKVAILYAINAKVMNGGAVENFDYFKDGWESFSKDMTNLVYSLVKRIYAIIIQHLYEYLLSRITPVIEAYITEITLERVQRYKDILALLISLYTGTSGIAKQIRSLLKGTGHREYETLDEVYYADIVGQEIKEQPL